MPATKLDTAEKEREKLEADIAYIKRKQTPAMDQTEVDHYTTEATDLQVQIRDNYEKILNCSPVDLLPYETKYDTMRSDVTKLIIELKRKKAAFIVVTPAATTPPPGSSQIRLPKISMPQFSGKIKDWMSFRDLYTAAVHGNSSITKAQKFTYLSSCLEGEAAQLLKSMELTDTNYDIAWDTLNNRYQNERELFFSILTRFIRQPSMNGESATALRAQVDVTKECVRALENLKVPVDKWDGILVYLLVQKLDPTSRKFWELSLKTTDIPTLKEYLDFIELQARGLAAEKPGKSSQKSSSETHKVAYGNYAHGDSKKQKCFYCTGNHYIHTCEKFQKLTPQERNTAAKNKSLCMNCLRPGHRHTECKNEKRCFKCKSAHHSLLHMPSTSNGSSTSTAVGLHSKGTQFTQTILATAQVRVEDEFGVTHNCRALLDGGSTSSFISEACVRRIGLKRNRSNTHVSGIGSMTAGNAKGMVSIKVLPHFPAMEETSYSVTTLILPRVTERLPIELCNKQNWTHLSGLLLADPEFHHPGDVDILLGADVFWDTLLDGKRKGSKPGSPIAIRTTLGWIVAGNLNTNSQRVLTHHVTTTLDETLQKFWELESIPEQQPVRTHEEQLCEEHFDSTTTRDQTGRYVVSLPIKESVPALGPSREIAVRRLKQLERRLEKREEYRREYNSFMSEYEALGHMSRVTEEDSESDSASATPNYIPHHFVLKESSTTTKFRVVFDASAKSASGISLNERLMVGPTIQDNMIAILMRFRVHPVAFTCDIEKMYGQILVRPEDRDLQRIVWRADPEQPIQEYKLLTTTYGTASAPYQATKVLQRLAEDEKDDYPLAYAVAKDDFFMDDGMSGASDVSKVLKIQSELLQLMARGGFNVRKWSSNSPEVLEALPEELRETKLPLSIDLDETVKTLGLRWNPALDEFSFKVNLPPVTKEFTKRSFLSEVSKVFDPLGWLAPTVIRAKVMFQELWKIPVGWDDPLPANINEQWLEYRKNLPSIEGFRVRRCHLPLKAGHPELFGFSDASEKAYSACVYFRAIQEDGQPIVTLVAAKTRVAPSKTVSIPRLELCGALLLAQLIEAVKKSMKVQFEKIGAWTDSTVVLDWLKNHPSKWKTFVANRVTQIQNLIPYELWGHVSGVDNPADCASRGIDPTELCSHPLWWRGPRWLMDEDPRPHHIQSNPDPAVTAAEQRNITVSHVCTNTFQPLFDVSSYTKLTRITAWCRRFIHNCRRQKKLQSIQSSRDPLTTDELNQAIFTLVKIVQQTEFAGDIQRLETGRQLSTTSKLKTLNPFMDLTGVLRVGGRLRRAALPVDQKTPMLLPRHHKLTSLIIEHYHLTHLHAGPQLLLTTLLRRFWIVGAKSAVRHQIKMCVVCTRHSHPNTQQIMADLPLARVTPTRAFLVCGVDYAGPFTMRAIPARSKVTYKAYLALFVCFSTRALHLEIVSSLSSNAFLEAFRRFVSRRGRCSDIHSDCGTNFVGAEEDLKELYDMVNSPSHGEKVAAECAGLGIRWHFNPPSAPHFGGLWEAGVRSVKHHLYRVVGKTRLTYEELSTVTCKIEACLNSRPLTPLSDDPNDLAALTPGHFLIGESLMSIPEPDLTTTPVNRLTRWQLTQQLSQHFWRRWSAEYLSRLHQRPKWLKHRTEIKIHDMVLVKDERLPPLKWRLGRVIATHPGPDGLIRVVTVKTAEGELKRPVVKLCLLPMDKSAKIQDEVLISDAI